MSMGSTTMTGFTLAEGLFKSWQDAFTRFNFRMPSPNPSGQSTDYLYFLIFLMSTFFFILLMGMMIVFIVKYRKVGGRAPQRSVAHNTFLELSWSVIPTLLLAWIFFEGFFGYADKVVAPGNARELVVTGQMWSWNVAYPNGAASPESTRSRGFSVSPTGFDTVQREDGSKVQRTGAVDVPIIVVPENEPVKLRMHSVDVIHSFWIPDFRVKFDVMPNRYTSMWFQTDAIDRDKAAKNNWRLEHDVYEGDPKRPTKVRKPMLDAKGEPVMYNDHWVFCAEYCGQMHSEMAAIIRVVPVAAYESLIKDWAEPRGTPEEIGKALYKIKGCNACHSVDGSSNVGPTWKNMYGYEQPFTDGTTITGQDMTGTGFANYIRESVYEPAKKIVQGYPNQMQSYQGRVNDRELEGLIAYMRSLSDRAPKGDAPAEPGKDAPKEEPKNEMRPAASATK
jgi:cytochrome c oxidase subunit II